MQGLECSFGDRLPYYGHYLTDNGKPCRVGGVDGFDVSWAVVRIGRFQVNASVRVIDHPFDQPVAVTGY